MWKVLKLGGSVLDSKNRDKLLNIFVANTKNTVYVVSALRGVTNELEEFLTKGSLYDVNGFCEKLRDRYTSFLKTFPILSIPSFHEEIKTLREKSEEWFTFKNIESKVEILSIGEKMSSISIQTILNSLGFHSKILAPREAYLKTVGNDLMNAKLDVRYCESHLKLKEGIFVIPGFFGVNSYGKIALLGKNGSDYTAAVIAAALNADFLGLYKNVPMMSCNPSFVECSVKVKSLSYEDAETLAFFGANILHPLTVYPLKRKNIPLRIYSMDSSLKTPATTVSRYQRNSKNPSKVITFTNVRMVKLKFCTPESRKKIMKKLKDSETKNVIVSPMEIKVILDENETFNHSLKDVQFSSENNLVLITVSGNTTFDEFAKISLALTKKRINVKYLSFNDRILSLTVGKKDAKSAIRVIHDELFRNSYKKQISFHEERRIKI